MVRVAIGYNVPSVDVYSRQLLIMHVMNLHYLIERNARALMILSVVL